MSVPILTTPAAVAAFAQELTAEPIFAVDLEADSMHCYQEKVCLLQFSTPSRTLLIDPLAVTDLGALRPVMADPSVRKVFHAGDYDIRCLHRDCAIEVRGLFDTMVACQFLGEEKVGLADILNKYYGVVLDKQYQRADWSQRPLSPPMVAYAAADTTHLLALAQKLEQRLLELGRLEWVKEEFALLEQVRHQQNNGPMFLKTKGAAALDRRQLAILEALLQWRDGEARRRDRAPFKILGPNVLVELARTAPTELSKMNGIEGFPARMVERYGPTLLPLIAAALALPTAELPVFPRSERRERDPAADKRLTRLKQWRTAVATELNMEPGIVINNALLEEISRQAPHTLDQLGALPGMKNWQRQILGAGILAALAAPPN